MKSARSCTACGLSCTARLHSAKCFYFGPTLMRHTIVIHCFAMVLVVAGCGTVREAEALPFPSARYTLVIALPEGGSGAGDIAGIVAGSAFIRSLQLAGMRLRHITIRYSVYNVNGHAIIMERLDQLPGVRIVHAQRE